MFEILLLIGFIINFNSDIKLLSELSHSFPIVVFFFSPWCPHCVPLFPAWNSLTTKYENDTSFLFGIIDCSFNLEPCRFSNGYPRMLILRDDEKHFIHFSEKGEGLENIIISNISKLRPYKFPLYNQSVDQKYPAYVLESSYVTNETKKMLIHLQISLPQFSSNFYYKANKINNENNDINENNTLTFKYFHDQDHFAILQKEINDENIKNFILDQQHIPFGEWNWDIALESPRAAVFLIYNPKESSIVESLRNLSYNYTQNFIFTKIKYTLFEKSFRLNGLRIKDLPALIITDNMKYSWNMLKNVQMNEQLIDYFDAANNNQIKYQNSKDLTEIFTPNSIDAYEEDESYSYTLPYLIIVVIIFGLLLLRHFLHISKDSQKNVEHID